MSTIQKNNNKITVYPPDWANDSSGIISVDVDPNTEILEWTFQHLSDGSKKVTGYTITKKEI